MKSLFITIFLLLLAPIAHSQSADDYFMSGSSKYDIKDQQRATADYTQAIRLNPEIAEAYYGRGAAKLILKNIDSACMDFSKAGELGLPDAYDAIRENCN
jgi:tetratricopeptide (TPR) repeat protein